MRVGELIDNLKELRWISFDVLDVGMGDDEGEECFLSAVVGLRHVSDNVESKGDGKDYFNSCLNCFPEGRIFLDQCCGFWIVLHGEDWRCGSDGEVVAKRDARNMQFFTDII